MVAGFVIDGGIDPAETRKRHLVAGAGVDHPAAGDAESETPARVDVPSAPDIRRMFGNQRQHRAGRNRRRKRPRQFGILIGIAGHDLQIAGDISADFPFQAAAALGIDQQGLRRIGGIGDGNVVAIQPIDGHAGEQALAQLPLDSDLRIFKAFRGQIGIAWRQ